MGLLINIMNDYDEDCIGVYQLLADEDMSSSFSCDEDDWIDDGDEECRFELCLM